MVWDVHGLLRAVILRTLFRSRMQIMDTDARSDGEGLRMPLMDGGTACEASAHALVRAPCLVGAGNRRLFRAVGRRAVANPFSVLGLPVTADHAEVKAAFRKFAKLYHPDVPESGDVDKFRAVSDAAEALSTDAGLHRWRSSGVATANARSSPNARTSAYWRSTSGTWRSPGGDWSSTEGDWRSTGGDRRSTGGDWTSRHRAPRSQPEDRRNHERRRHGGGSRRANSRSRAGSRERRAGFVDDDFRADFFDDV